ncbi:hypothetical protein [Desulfocucumis palustris]|uniref:hypothetical protein n=1 Tax=Desulfocucumis palustris TaxID=1898651 RepID=UPI000FFEE08D|nr:hypothetical protein [Desulfocucumis palustris]
MEALLSVLSGAGGLALGVWSFWDLAVMGSSGIGRGRVVKCALKMLGALLLLHFHFELDMLE